jgi:choice-of-anchor C domain-containing protein
MRHLESLENRTLFSATPVAVTMLLAEAKLISADDRAVLIADAAGIRAVTAAVRVAKQVKPDAVGLKALTKANAADLIAIARSIRTVDLAVTTDTKRLLSAGTALAKRPTNAKLSTQVSTLKAKLLSDASAAIAALTTADARLAFDDNGASSNLPDVVSSANQVFDGGFEVPDVGSGGPSDGYPGSGALLYFASGSDSFSSIPLSGTTLDGAWHVQTGSVDQVGTPLWSAAEGTQSIDLDGINAGALYQDVPTVVGQQYTLSFELAGNPGGTEPKIVQVSAGSSTQQFSFDATNQTFSQMGWTEQTLSFTATSASTRVLFSSQDAASSVQGPALDDVIVTSAAPTSAQPKISAAVTSYQTTLAAEVQKLNRDSYTALTLDADNVASLYA